MKYLIILNKFGLSINKFEDKIKKLDSSAVFYLEDKNLVAETKIGEEKILDFSEVSEVFSIFSEWDVFSFEKLKKRCLDLCKSKNIKKYFIDIKFYNKIPISAKSIYRHINPYLRHEEINFDESGDVIYLEFKRTNNKIFYRISYSGRSLYKRESILSVDMGNFAVVIENPSLASEVGDFLRLCWIFKLPLYIITHNKKFDSILDRAKNETKGIDYNKFEMHITKDLPRGFTLVGFSKHSDRNEGDMKSVLLSGKNIALVFGDDKYGLTQETRDKLDYCFRLTPELKKPLRGSHALSYVLGFYTANKIL